MGKACNYVTGVVGARREPVMFRSVACFANKYEDVGLLSLQKRSSFGNRD
jgi:hypothetical protein